jgi:hypothetical protein
MSSKKVWKVKVDGVRETIRRSDVDRYFAHGHGVSGMRSLGPVSGDWRMIDRLAEDAAAYFETEECS